MIPTNELIQQERSLKSSRCNLSPRFSINRINVGVILKAVSCHHTLLGNWDVDNIFFFLQIFCSKSVTSHNTATADTRRVHQADIVSLGLLVSSQPMEPRVPGYLVGNEESPEPLNVQDSGSASGSGSPGED